MSVDFPKHPQFSEPQRDAEEEFISGTRKERKQLRKIISAKDRSKHKKSDRDQLHKNRELASQSLIDENKEYKLGRVISIASEGIEVACDNKTFTCMLRGVLKKEKTSAKNLVIVGDFVRFECHSETEGSIVYVEPRKSFLSRADTLSQRKEHLIAANIDQVLITVSILNPPLRTSLVDRYIIATRRGNMTPIIVVNKIDLLDQVNQIDEKLYEDFLQAYATAGVPVVSVSAETNQGLEALRAVMKDRASVFAGQSGVGKSSLINSVTGLNLAVGETVDKTRKGSHTTTKAHLVPLEFGGWCIDTPGIKSFGLWELKQEDVQEYYTEMHPWSLSCKYPNCKHLQEPECAVKQAVIEGKISLLRYESYESLMSSMAQEHLRR